MFYEIILDSGETPNKCTIAPLSYREDFHLFRVKGGGPLGPLSAPILLHHQGECLTTMKSSAAPIPGISSVDCVWRRLDPLLRRVQGTLPKLARIPDGFVTAYPRQNKSNLDPDGGLATIEAIFVAAAILGNWDVTLLSEYHFGRKFVELNRARFLELGITQASQPELQPIWAPRPKTSVQRRVNRGQKLSKIKPF